MKKRARAFVLLGADGHMLPEFIRETKRDVIVSFLWAFHRGQVTWNELQRKGFRVVRCDVSLEETKR